MSGQQVYVPEIRVIKMCLLMPSTLWHRENEFTKNGLFSHFGVDNLAPAGKI